MVDFTRNLIARLIKDERGLTAVEYAVLGAMIVAAIAAVGLAFQPALVAKFTALLA
jgi:pilus assembly protein Flp/PilA